MNYTQAAELDSATITRIQDKLADLQSLAPKWVEAGGDGDKMAGYAATFAYYLSKADYVNAEKALDDGIALAKTTPANPKDSALISIERKIKDLQSLAPEWARLGGNVETGLKPLFEKFSDHMTWKKYTDAEKVLDDMLALVKTTP